MDYGLKQALKVLIALACGVSVTAASISINNKNNSKTLEKNEQINETIETLDYTPISKTESQVGKYADIDGDGTVDGIIFADLAAGGSGIWNEYDKSLQYAQLGGTFSYPKKSISKDYYISQKSYTNKLGGTAEVLTPIGTGEDRFYVMALENTPDNHITFDWYHSAIYHMNDYANISSLNFGTGYNNTLKIINKWQNNSYGEKDACIVHKDLWGQIQNQVNNGWFMPSSGEWAAFAYNLQINPANYSKKGLSGWYWSSSQYNISNAWYANLNQGIIGSAGAEDAYSIRLAHTF